MDLATDNAILIAAVAAAALVWGRRGDLMAWIKVGRKKVNSDIAQPIADELQELECDRIKAVYLSIKCIEDWGIRQENEKIHDSCRTIREQFFVEPDVDSGEDYTAENL